MCPTAGAFPLEPTFVARVDPLLPALAPLGAGRKPPRLAAPAMDNTGAVFMLAAWRSLTLFSVCSVMGHAQSALVRPRNRLVAVHGSALRARHLCTRAEHVRAKVPGSFVLVQAIMSAIDDYAERETGNREYFWYRPHSAG